ncbi:hypothetical protein U9M48_012155 [Paspalum notatum var. saurae]|uniref:Reverse transcriptase domain-containing protein n=1 Tax=Paspalum notatum var. saurae TaxID=547442 RepID=A0AAQ3SWZ8_PASNO
MLASDGVRQLASAARQGDPLSPLLFALAIDPLEYLLHLATEAITRARARLRISMYADDAIIFIKPEKRELENLAVLLHFFGEAIGLHTNIQKSSIVPIKCAGLNLDGILAGFPASRASFSIRYLGISLTVARLKKVDFQYLIDKDGKVVISPMQDLSWSNLCYLHSVYTHSAVNVPKEVLEEIDKLRKRFLWAGNENLTGGKCKVNWPTVARPLDLGGLGVLDIHRFGRALRLCWLWRQWEDPNAPWAGLETPCNDTDKLLFAAATKITIGNGDKTSFWHCAWVEGRGPKDIAPDIFAASLDRKLSVREALVDNAWVSRIDLQAIQTADHLKQFVELWSFAQLVSLAQNTEDRIDWTYNASRPLLTGFNSWVTVTSISKPLSGSHGGLLNANSSLGSSSAIVFGLPTGSQPVAGRIVPLARFAGDIPRQLIT